MLIPITSMLNNYNLCLNSPNETGKNSTEKVSNLMYYILLFFYHLADVKVLYIYC